MKQSTINTLLILTALVFCFLNKQDIEDAHPDYRGEMLFYDDDDEGQLWLYSDTAIYPLIADDSLWHNNADNPWVFPSKPDDSQEHAISKIIRSTI